MADADKSVFTKEELDAAIAESVAGLKANREEALREAKAAKAKLAAFDGVDAEEHKRLKAAAAEAEQKRALAAGDFESMKKQLVDQHGAEKSALEGRIKKYQSAVERRAVQAELVQAITAEKGNAKMLLPYAKQFVRVRETDDDFEAYVADEKGNPMIGDAQGAPMTITQFVQQTLKTEFPGAFEGTGSSGGGASKSTAGGGGQKVIAAGDEKAFIDNLKEIASGKVNIR